MHQDMFLILNIETEDILEKTTNNNKKVGLRRKGIAGNISILVF